MQWVRYEDQKSVRDFPNREACRCRAEKIRQRHDSGVASIGVLQELANNIYQRNFAST
jgi:hypothetical protein